MRQLAQYFTEREGYSCVQREEGFAAYKIEGDYCYLRDIWVDPDYRKKGIAAAIADEVADRARKAGCRYMTGSVETSLPSATASTKVLLAYGMEITGVIGSGILFRKVL